MSFSMEVISQQDIKKVLEEQVKPVPEELKKIKEVADNNVTTIMNLSLESEFFEERKNIVSLIDSFGLNTLKISSEKNLLFNISIGNIFKMGDEGGKLVQGLSDLETILNDLDPSNLDFTKKGFLGKFFNPLSSYFKKYEKSENMIVDIIDYLEKGKYILKNDNTTLEIEQQTLRDLTKTLHKEIDLGLMMDDLIERSISDAETRGENSEKIRFIKEEILFPLRERISDLQLMLIVNQQGIMSFEMLIRNNKQLIRGIDRAKTVTITVLKTAIIVASSLYNQKIVLNKIESFNKKTSDVISMSSNLFKEQGLQLQNQSVNTNTEISIDTLKQSFYDVMEVMDSIKMYKQDVLPELRESISQFKQLSNEGELQVLRIEKENR